MVHVLKLHAWPNSPSADHWRDDTGVFLDDAARRISPSMRQRIDLADLYVWARQRVRAATDRGPFNAPPDACPFTFDERLARDVAALAAKLAHH